MSVSTSKWIIFQKELPIAHDFFATFQNSDAAMMTMRRKICGRTPEEIKAMKKEDLDLPITGKDFDEATVRCKKSVSDTDVKRYEKWLKQYGSQ